jgi:hypothetical protein
MKSFRKRFIDNFLNIIDKNRDKVGSIFNLKSIIIFIISIILFIYALILIISINKYEKEYKILINRFSEFEENLKEINMKLNISKINQSSAELLINNTNVILSTVYFATADIKDQKETVDFTAFSIIYKEKYYIITAGHCIEIADGTLKNFRFRANNKNYYITPKLIDFKNEPDRKLDYAIFYSPNIIRYGLYPASSKEDKTPKYILGNIERDLNFIKQYESVKKGESGSPILNSECHVIGIIIKKNGEYTPIEVVLKALDEIEEKYYN